MDRFWDTVAPEPNTGCWLWMGFVQAQGYGTISYQGRDVRAHRLAYELFVGPIPEGLCVLHKCDVRICVNPDHLWLGTRQQNMADMVRKGRQVRGEKIHGAKLTWDKVREIRRRGATETATALGREFGVSMSQASRIILGQKWREPTSSPSDQPGGAT